MARREEFWMVKKSGRRARRTLMPAVERLVQTNLRLFLEAERRRLSDEIVSLEQEIEKKRARKEERERDLTVVEARLPRQS